MPTAEECSKCQKELDTEGTPKWCKACRAKYQKEYQATKEGKAEAHGFARGVTAFRRMIAEKFEGQGSGAFTGQEISYMVLNEPGPDQEP